MKTHRRSLLSSLGSVVIVAAMIAPIACAGNAGKVATGPTSGGSAPGASGINYVGQMECVDSGNASTSVRSPLVLQTVHECSYFGGPGNRLVLEFAHSGPDTRDLTRARISGFTKAGSFPTTADETDTDTYVNTHGFKDIAEPDGAHLSPGGTSAGAPDCRGACTITITDASVIGTPVGEKGRIAGSIDCSSLTAAGVGCTKCTVTSPRMDFDIADCQHYE